MSRMVDPFAGSGGFSALTVVAQLAGAPAVALESAALLAAHGARQRRELLAAMTAKFVSEYPDLAPDEVARYVEATAREIGL
jgi:hypothetical protein